MRAAVINKAGSAPVCAEFPEPAPHPGQALTRLVGAGLHQVVRSIASGAHYGAAGIYPLVPGVDAVARAEDGRLVYTGWPRAPWGTFAELLATPVALELPGRADPLAVAAGVNPGMSGWLPLSARRAEVGMLGTVLVLGATGVSGGMAIQSAFALGAQRVIGAGRDGAALQRVAALGATPVSLAGGDPVESLSEALGQDTPTLVLDYVWGAVAEATFTALGRRGLDDDTADISYVQIGALGGPAATLPASLLRSRRIRVSGSGAGSATTERILAEIPRIMQLIADGTLEVPYTAYPLNAIDRAWAHTGPGRAVVVPIT